ncbi:Protein fluorescent in blue light, chloroplastic [Apostasia shenzhenica]|uniref:Protein fluorescent in blue light, chloroplastic n=1 Tax=Apostasia shenzhenica TaxID=1088818 RepID=A0A2H9ZVG5_9ASPA|nr:Protein fluorescent in blue light, chloroplastic [Apostasia shenzhenica]
MSSSTCYQLLQRQYHEEIPRALLEVPSHGYLPSQMLGILSIRMEKAAIFFMRTNHSSQRGKIFASIRPKGTLQMSVVSKVQHAILDFISNNQKHLPVSFEKGLILANSLVLTLPLQALAQTCQTDRSEFKLPLFFSVALIGAIVGGLLARQRRGELKRVNDQLRQINEALRRQAKIESYAPDLTYAPVGKMTAREIVVDPRKELLISSLRTGKSFLRMQDLERATVEFRRALDLAQDLEDHAEEKKAARGLGASLQRQRKYREAIKYYSRVLEISKLEGEDFTSTEAYGAIADCFTELGELERAAKFYDKYIERLEAN